MLSSLPTNSVAPAVFAAGVGIPSIGESPDPPASRTQIAKMPNEPNFRRNPHKSNDLPSTKRTDFRTRLSLCIRVHPHSSAANDLC
jgi:hypothetical protein